jgi:hypothetical protein
MNERDALALIDSGKTVREIVRDHSHELEIHMDVGQGVIARAKLDLVEDEEGEKVKATSLVERLGPDGRVRKMRITAEVPIDDAQALFEEAVESNLAALYVKKAADFLQARNGSRKVMFARRLTPPVSESKHKYLPRAEFLEQHNGARPSSSKE